MCSPLLPDAARVGERWLIADEKLRYLLWWAANRENHGQGTDYAKTVDSIMDRLERDSEREMVRHALSLAADAY